jgi:hypothetical protein
MNAVFSRVPNLAPWWQWRFDVIKQHECVPPGSRAFVAPSLHNTLTESAAIVLSPYSFCSRRSPKRDPALFARSPMRISLSDTNTHTSAIRTRIPIRAIGPLEQHLRNGEKDGRKARARRHGAQRARAWIPRASSSFVLVVDHDADIRRTRAGA